MNTHNAQAGDRFTDTDGKVWEVRMVFPAGGAGVSHAAGPRVMLGLVGEDGNIIPRGLSRTVQHGGMYSPADYSPVSE